MPARTRLLLLASVLLAGLPASTRAEELTRALEAVAAEPTAANVARALDIGYRNDAWRDVLPLASRWAARPELDPDVRWRVARALWRAGELQRAAAVAEGLTPGGDPDVLARLIETGLAVGRDIGEPLRRLERSEHWTPGGVAALLAGRVARNDYRGLGPLLRRAEDVVAGADGYPADLQREELAGLPDYFEAMGDRRLNQLARGGEALLQVAMFTPLPVCDAVLNGEGPYRLLVDTGGSVVVSLDADIADEIGLESVAPAVIRGISGSLESGQCTLAALELGSIRVEQAMVRTFPLPDMLRGTADGVLGTGVFGSARLTFDLARQRLIVAASSAEPAAGVEVPCWLAGDRKIYTRVTLAGAEVTALVDTGADVVAVTPAWLRGHFEPGQLRRTDVAAAAGVGESDDQQQLWFSPPVDLRWGGRDFPQTAVIGLEAVESTLGRTVGVHADALIGMALLRNADRLTIDYGTARMWVHWRAPAEGE